MTAMSTTGPQVANREPGRGSLLSRLRSYLFFAPMVYLYTGVMGTLSLLSSLTDREGRVQHWFARTWARMILKTVMVRVRVEGLDHINPAQTAIYAANHLSALDIPVLYACLPVQVPHYGEEGAVSVSVSRVAPETVGADTD